MPDATLDGLTLSENAAWLDERAPARAPVVQSSRRTITGAMILFEEPVTGGLPVTVDGGRYYTGAEVAALAALRSPGREMALVLADGRTLAVAWDYAAGALETTPPWRPTTGADTAARYRLTLHLLEL